MGSCRTHRPFVWQDEMAEVRNLFRKVAQVRDSGFTGFSLWKDEPSAETLSRNRLRRRRCQYALELTHLNYGESPYDALNHLHNIRGMCSRIQRQSRYVERKKKSYDADLHPALLRRPVTASYSWASAKDGSDTRSLRPGSAPVMADTPLHYTPSKPTILYDATHRCPRYKETTKRFPLFNSSNPHIRPGRATLKAMGNNNNNWEATTGDSTGCSSPLLSSSIASSTTTNRKVAQSEDATPKLGESMTKRRGDLELANPEVETTFENRNTALYSEIDTSEASLLLSNGAPPIVSVAERPLSRMMSKRPSPDVTKVVEKHSGTTTTHRKDVHVPSRESIGRERAGSNFASSPSPRTRGGEVNQSGRPPSQKTGESGRLLEERRGKSNPSGSALAKGKSALSPPSDGSGGLWALRQDQQRPTSAGAMMPRATIASSLEQSRVRPATSATRVVVQNSPKQEGVSKFCSRPSANKIVSKKEQPQVRVAQRAFDQGLQPVVFSEYGNNETHHTPTRSEREELKPPAQPHYNYSTQQRPADPIDSGNGNVRANEQLNNNTSTDGDENHVMIKHSTDPYADFKHSMLRMIDEEDLYDKRWELEELFQYYMDLNPAVHHEVLQIVISDIRKNIETYKAHRSCYPDSP